MKSEDMKIKKFEMLIRDVDEYLGRCPINNSKVLELFINRNPQNVWMESVFNNSFSDSGEVSGCLSGDYSDIINTNDIISFIEGMRWCKDECGFESHCNDGSHLMFWLIFMISIDSENYNNNLSVVSDTAFMLGFDEEKLSDWITAVKGVLAGKKLSELEYQTKEGTEFFIR